MLAAGAVVLATVVILVIGNSVQRDRGSRGQFDPSRVRIVTFADESGLERSRAQGRMAQDYIIQSLTEAGFAEVVDPLTALAVSQNVAAGGIGGGPKDILALANDARAGTTGTLTSNRSATTQISKS
jgi:hypothetical protein